LFIRITFTFKSSRRSNNGTDINAGQIPEILYRTVIPDSLSISTIHTSNSDIHILSDAFSHTVNKVLNWIWFWLINACFSFFVNYDYFFAFILFCMLCGLLLFCIILSYCKSLFVFKFYVVILLKISMLLIIAEH